MQARGALILIQEPELRIVQASLNAPRFLALDEGLLGRSLDDLDAGLAGCIRPHLGQPLTGLPLALRAPAAASRGALDLLLHRLPSGGLMVEIEPGGPSLDYSAQAQAVLRRIVAAASLRELYAEAAGFFKSFSGYDRVMLCRLDEDGCGEVCAEVREPDLVPFLGSSHPVWARPARVLGVDRPSRIQLVADVLDRPISLDPVLSPLTGQPPDLSRCILRAHPDAQLEYLKGLRVRASLTIALHVGGRLWGLLVFHHRTPRHPHYEVRAVCELVAEAVATRVAALESFVQAQAELSVRQLEQRMLDAISSEGDWIPALFHESAPLLSPLGATGAALICEGQVHRSGRAPDARVLREIAAWLDSRPSSPVMATASLGRDAPAFAHLAGIASGLIAAPVSRCPGEYLIWLRPGKLDSVVLDSVVDEPHGGAPAVIGAGLAEMPGARPIAIAVDSEPSCSCSALPWTEANRLMARLIGESVADIIQQFRSVRVLIAQAQLAQARSQVQISEQPILITNSEGLVMLATRSLECLLQVAGRPLESLQDLAALVRALGGVADWIDDLLHHRRPWRGELSMRSGHGPLKRFLVRADPVFSSPGRVLGFVIFLTDITSRGGVEDVQRRLQTGLIADPQAMGSWLGGAVDARHHELWSTILGNARLAALELADGVDPQRVPAMVDSVQASVSRTTELLEHLVRYAGQVSPDSGGEN